MIENMKFWLAKELTGVLLFVAVVAGFALILGLGSLVTKFKMWRRR